MSPFAGGIAALATRHGKERVIGPSLGEALGLCVEVAGGVDTDGFGTFTREVSRVGTPRETARVKARAAIAAHGATTLGVSSEGSFGAHPAAPFVAGGVEIVLLLDATTELELIGTDVTMDTNFASVVTRSIDEAIAFAPAARFPSHGLMVIDAPQGRPEPAQGIVKGLRARPDLERAVEGALRRSGQAWIETDMRAHMNPTRMRSIARAARALASAAQSLCPTCDRPGYVAVERLSGLPCAECAAPTSKPRAEVLACDGCGRREERALAALSLATPFDCPECNP